MFPNYNEVVTPSYINDIITSRTWLAGGSDIDEWMHDHNVTENNLSESLSEFLPHRFNYVLKMLTNCIKIHGTEKGLLVKRSVVLTPSELEQVLSTHAGYYGLCFSTEREIAYCATRNIGDHDVVLYADVPFDCIDFVETIRARIDYNNGDEEFEIRIKPNTNLNFYKIKHHEILS